MIASKRYTRRNPSWFTDGQARLFPCFRAKPCCADATFRFQRFHDVERANKSTDPFNRAKVLSDVLTRSASQRPE
jgi:hypothetical protein